MTEEGTHDAESSDDVVSTSESLQAPSVQTLASTFTNFSQTILNVPSEIASFTNTGSSKISSSLSSAALCASKQFINSIKDTQTAACSLHAQYIQNIEKVALEKARSFIHFCVFEHPLECQVVTGLSLLALFPPFRSLLYSSTIGLFRSEEAMLKAYTRNYNGLIARDGIVVGEKSKLMERLREAEDEFNKGKMKLKGALVQLRGEILEVCIFRTCRNNYFSC